MKSEKRNVCVNCGRSGEEVPLLQFEYQRNTYSICPQDLPEMIHQPAKMSKKFPKSAEWAKKGGE